MTRGYKRGVLSSFLTISRGLRVRRGERECGKSVNLLRAVKNVMTQSVETSIAHLIDVICRTLFDKGQSSGHLKSDASALWLH